MDNQVFNKAYGSIMGLAIGDALGSPVEGWKADEIRKKIGWISDFLTDEPVGTDDTEYALLTAQLLIRYGDLLTPEHVAAEWRSLIETNQMFGGGFSETAAIENLKASVGPPLSGRKNPEMWSDGSAMRVSPVGVFCAGDPEKAAWLAKVNSVISHAKDGIYSAQAVAASVAVAMVTNSFSKAIRAGMDWVPKDSWTYRMIAHAVEVGSGCPSLKEAALQLHDQVSIHHYYWVDVGPEAVALAFGALAAAKGDYEQSVLCSVNCGRDADTIAAIAGGIAGALNGIQRIPEKWIQRIRPAKGECIGTVADADIRNVVQQLVRKMEKDHGMPKG